MQANEHDHWHARWAEGRIGFHQDEVNGMLKKHWPAVGAPPGSRVLVPLYGKTLDMLYLRDLGHEVIGVEISPVAAEQFGDHDGVTIVVGDYFTADVPTCDVVYDRAAMIALPRSWRARYVERTRELLRGPGRGLVLTLEYPEDEHTGPPLSIGPDEVKAHLDAELLESQDLIALGFGRWGLSSMWQHTMAPTFC